MGQNVHRCQGCDQEHFAPLWYYREGEREMAYWREWMCGYKYNELRQQEKDRWCLWDPLTL